MLGVNQLAGFGAYSSISGGGGVAYAAAGSMSAESDSGYDGTITLLPGAPAGVVVGSLLILQVASQAGGTTTYSSIDTPTGWTLLTSVTGDSSKKSHHIFYRWATGEAADTPSPVVYNTDTALASQGYARIYRFSGGPGAGSPADGSASNFQAASTTLNPVDLTTSIDNSFATQFIVVFAYTGATGSFTTESGVDYTEQVTANNAATFQVQGGAKATAGAITGGAYTLASSKIKSAIGVGLKSG